MSHLSHDDLVLLYYGEPDADRSHLSGCNDCADEFARLSAALDRFAAFDVPEPADDYEQKTWLRLEWKLARERKQNRRSSIWFSVAAMLAIAVVGSLVWFRGSVQTAAPQPPMASKPVASPASTEAQRDRILLVVVSDHFEESERVLVELTNLTPDANTDISNERTRAEELLASNRLYRRTALDRGEENVATLLDELEPVLIQIAHASAQPGASEIRSIQKRVEAKGLVFKLRVVRAGVRADQRTQPMQPNV
jgi:hypothetical protein